MSHTTSLRLYPFTEILTGLQWGVGSGVILGACFGMTTELLGSYGVHLVCQSYTSPIVSLALFFCLSFLSREFRALFSLVTMISSALVFAMVQHQFAGDLLTMGSIIFIILFTYVFCVIGEVQYR